MALAGRLYTFVSAKNLPQGRADYFSDTYKSEILTMASSASKTTCSIGVENLNKATSDIISTLPNLTLLGGLVLLALYNTVKYGRILFSKDFANNRYKMLEQELGKAAEMLNTDKELIAANLSTMVLSKRPQALVEKLTNNE